MKIIFEYEDGTYKTVSNIKLTKINERTAINHEVDRLMSDVDVTNKYIVADDNTLDGNLNNRDVGKYPLYIRQQERKMDNILKMIKEDSEKARRGGGKSIFPLYLPPKWIETDTEFVQKTPWGDIVIKKKGKKNV